MWFSLGNPIDGAGDVHVLLPQVAALARFAAEIDGRLLALGLDGLAGALELHATLRAVLDPISSRDLEEIRRAVAVLERRFTELERSLAALRRLKELGSAP